MLLQEASAISMAIDANMERGAAFAAGAGVCGWFSARSPDKDSCNEDAAAVIPVNDEAVVLAVADGLGGLPGGEAASRIAIETLRECVLEAAGTGEKLRTAILNAFEEAHRRVQALGVGAATTLAVVEVAEGQARPYHVGDSIILIASQRGRVKLQTISHSPVGFAVEAGLLNASDAMHHEDRHIVSNVIGIEPMRIEMGSGIELARRDTLLLASDGLIDNLHDAEIVERIRKGPLIHAVDRLANDARARMMTPQNGLPSKPDDLTFIVYRRGK